MVNLVRKNDPIGTQPLRVRLVRCQVPKGEPHILVTSVLRSVCKAREIGQLYRERWEIEELFKHWKSLAPTSRQFHSKTVAGIEQEVGARFLHLGICASYFATTMNENGWDNEKIHVNQKAGTTCIDEFLVVIFLSRSQETIRQHEAVLMGILRGLRYRRRPGRSAPRVSITPFPRWLSGGRTSRRKIRKRPPIAPIPRRGSVRKRLQKRIKRR